MRVPRFRIQKAMIAIVVVAAVLAVFRSFSYGGLVCLTPFCGTWLTSRFGKTPSERRIALVAGAIGTLLLPALAAFGLNYIIWGYFVRRPAVDRRIVEAQSIRSITRVETYIAPNGKMSFSGAPLGTVDEDIRESPYDGDYYVLAGRVLRALKTGHRLPRSPGQMSAERLAPLYTILDATGHLENGEPGYNDAKNLHGIVIEAQGDDGRPLVFVAVRGREVSNDHYPFYEFLFTSHTSGTSPRLLSAQRFYFDVAGIEGVEWPAFLVVFAIIGFIPALPAQAFVMAMVSRKQRAHGLAESIRVSP
jgi:hypothetical protein